MKLLRLDLNVAIDGVLIDELPIDKKDIIRRQLSEILLSRRPEQLKHIALMMLCEYGEREEAGIALNLKSEYSVEDLDNIDADMDVFISAGMKRGYAHRLMCIAEYKSDGTLGGLFRMSPLDMARTRWVGKKTIQILKDFFYNQYELEWK